jgi:hypothetical protein
MADSKRVSVSRDFLEKLIAVLGPVFDEANYVPHEGVSIGRALRQEGEDLLWKAQQYLDSQD